MRLTTLKIVVLPAPFGPITANISLSATEKLTPSTALRPPNCNEISVISRRGISAPPSIGKLGQPLAAPRYHGIDPVRLEQQDEDQGKAEQEWAQPRHLRIASREQSDQLLEQFR